MSAPTTPPTAPPPLLAAVVAAMPDAVVIADEAGRIVALNPRAAALFGFDAAELIGERIERLLPPEPAARRGDNGRDPVAVAAGAARGRRRDGGEFTAAIDRSPVALDGGRFVVAAIRDLTEQERVAAALREREQELAAVLEALPVAAMLTAADDGPALYTNRAFARLFGYEPGARPPRREWDAARYPDPAARAAAQARTALAVAAARRTGARETIEVEAMGAGGAPRQFALSVTPVGDEILFLFDDLTERRRAEARLRAVLDGTNPTTGTTFFSALTDQLRQALEVDYTFVAEREGKQLRVLAVTGPAGPEAPFTFALSGTPCAERANCTGCACASGVATRFPAAPFFAERGLEAFVCHPLLGTNGEQLGMLAATHRSAIDDTGALADMLRVFAGRAAAEIERDHADRALRALARELERRVALRAAEVQWQATALNESTEGLAIVSDWRVRYANRAFAQLLGYDAPADLVGRMWTDFLDADETQRVATPILATLVEERRWRGLLAARRRDGSHITVELGLALSPDSDIVAAARDVTERLRLTDQLRRGRDELSGANAQLQRASRAKDEFLATMSHELRTPLNAVLGISEALSEDVYGPLADAQRAALANVSVSGRHLLALINDVLDLTKIEAGHMTLDMDRVEVRTVCQAAAQLVRERALREQIDLVIAAPADVGSVPADQRRLKQMLLNLLDNALKFTPAGGRVTLDAARDDERGVVTFAVRDTGIGIAADVLPRLFTPFTQADSGLDREYGGTGLGLALVQRLAAMHGGSVAVTSVPGQGSTFTISLPLASPLAPAPAAPASPPAADVAPGGGELILIADDNPASATFVRDYLEAAGYCVALAPDGHEAVARARTDRPALILMDIQMPGLDGLEAIRVLRADATVPRMPILACTALAMPGDRERCLAAGADDYLAKPVRLKDLRAIIARHLARAPQETA